MALDYKSSLGRYRRYLQLVQSRPIWSATMWVIMSLILLIVLTLLALRPTLITISGLFGQIEQQKQVTARLDEKILAVRKAISEMESVKPDLPKLEAMIPTEPQWELLTDEIFSLASGSGAVISSITVDKIPTAAGEKTSNQQVKPQIPKGLIAIKFSVSGQGEYQQLTDLLFKLEKSQRVPLLTNVTIGENKDGSLDLTIIGEAAFLPETEL